MRLPIWRVSTSLLGLLLMAKQEWRSAASALGEAIRLEPGDEVTFSQEGNAIRLERVASPDALMGRLAGHRLVEALEKDRRAERRR